jgi:DNA-directed RNA polymerase subunit beta
VFVAKKRKIAEGDKLAGRHGNKGVISKIVPEEDMPFLEDGTPVDVILNPLGVPSRMNIGQILETHLGWAAARAGTTTAPRPTRRATAERQGLHRHRRCSTARPSRTRQRLVQWQREHRADQMDIDESRRPGRARRRQVHALQRPHGRAVRGARVTVGYMYILKLHHLVDDKIHARSPGPTRSSPSSRWAARGSSAASASARWRSGALEAYGAAYTLQEMLTIKSDDTVGA